MLVSIKCPNCNAEHWYEVKATIRAVRINDNVEVGHRLSDVRIKIQDKTEKMSEILVGLYDTLEDGVPIENVVKTLVDEYKLSKYCAETMIEKIKEHYNMYSPDGKKLYYA